jgi:predicted O-linked N-acetylglucosamine transferase (SPINDLY family)
MHPSDPRIEARRAIQREPQRAIAWILLSDAELDAGDAQAGRAAAERALVLAPGHPEALARLGRAHWMQGDLQAAAASLRAAARNAPQHPGIAVWLGHVLEDVGEAEAASEAYARAHALDPGEPLVAAYLLAWRRRLCDWRDLDKLSQQVRDAVRRELASVEPFAFLGEDSTAAEQLQCARLRAQMIAAAIRPLPPSAATRAGGNLRIAFLSNGFGAHPTGLLVVAFLEALSAHAEIETHLFSLDEDDGSDIRWRLQAAAHALHNVAGMPHEKIATTIRDAGIEVLFDLRGWGGGGTPEVLAMRPAPVQVNWLAYPGTSGAPWIDCVLADAFVLPESLAPHFSETVLRLPRCFQPSDSTRAIAAPRPRTDYGLPAQGIVYCCFNNSYKLNPASFSRAMQVLAGVDGSVLWLLSGPGRSDDRLREAARGAGVDPARLVFMDKQPQPEYLTRLLLADLFLDTNPYNAHTTASDALWAGCPVLTRPGDTFASRVAGSLNHHLGLDEMNVAGDDDFIALAIALGRDPARLQALREHLRAAKATSGLFDMPAFAMDFAAMAKQLVNRHRHASRTP